MSFFVDKNRKRIAQYLLESSVSEGEERLGLELEHFIVHEDGSIVVYAGPDGVEGLMEELAPYFQQEYRPEGHLLGLSCSDYGLSLEPGAQLEISISPKKTLEQIRRSYKDFRDLLDPGMQARGWHLETCGYHPNAKAEDIPLLPKERYRLMDQHFKSSGKQGMHMMRATASTQVSLDYRSEDDALDACRSLAAISPLLSLICDNTAMYNGKPSDLRMIRARIWNDVDPSRCGICPGMLGPEAGFASYAKHILDTSPLFMPDSTGAMHGCGNESAADLLDNRIADTTVIEHLLSMQFPDLRIKGFMELRVADSMPIDYALAYAALLKGLIYDKDNRAALRSKLPECLDEAMVAECKSRILERGYAARIYGKPAWEWADELFALAWRALGPEEQAYLLPLCKLLDKRSSLGEETRAEHKHRQGEMLAQPLSGYEKIWAAHIMDLGGDARGESAAYEFLQKSTARYHGQVLNYCRVPRLYDAQQGREFQRICRLTHSICVKMIRRYLSDPAYRKLFGFEALMEELICSENDCDQDMPWCRMDIFLNEDAPWNAEGAFEFMFCEFNTDGSSAMNEDLQISKAMELEGAWERMIDEEALAALPQSCFDPLVRSSQMLYRQWQAAHPQHPIIPRVGIVDFTESATSYEFIEFQKRFIAHGMPCVIADPTELVYQDGMLKDNTGARIDLIYRRVVGSELMERRCEAQGLIHALKENAVCCLGAMRTQVPHSKRSFYALHHELSRSFLSDEELEFVRAHVPRTYLLESSSLNMEELAAQKDRWIIKPDDGYAGKGVIAGVNCGDEQWRQALAEAVDKGYILQEYCPQMAGPNMPALPAEKRAKTPAVLQQYNNLIGMFIYDGCFQGLYTRLGQKGIISDEFDNRACGSMHIAPCVKHEL